MEQVQDLIKSTVSEIKEMLSSNRVVGDPITVGNATVIPLVAFGFGVSGKGGDSSRGSGEGTGGGSGGGGGARPVALIIGDENGVRVEPIKGTVSTLGENVSDAIVKVVSQRGGKKKESDSGSDK
jgi:uncharacterized spore protein YtfJ